MRQLAIRIGYWLFKWGCQDVYCIDATFRHTDTGNHFTLPIDIMFFVKARADDVIGGEDTEAVGSPGVTAHQVQNGYLS